MAITWLLYSLLDIILMSATLKSLVKTGGYQILFASAILCLVMSIILFRKKKITWTILEIGIVVLIIFCLTIWFFKGPEKAVIWGIISESIVGLYLLFKTINFPVVQYNLFGYTLFLIACIIAVYDAPNWSIMEVGYSASEVILTTLTILPLLRKWKNDYKKRRFTDVYYINKQYS